MGRRRAVDEAIAAIYAATLDETRWTEALRRISICLGSVGAGMSVTDDTAQRVRFWSSPGLDDAPNGAYRTHDVTADPRRRLAAANPHARLPFEYMLIDQRGIDRDEFYAWLSRNTDDYRRCLGCRAAIDAAHGAYAALNGHSRRGHVQREQIRLFRRLVPHLERALQISHRLGALEQRRLASEQALERLHAAVIFLDGRGRIVGITRAGEAVLAAADGLSVADGALGASHAGDHATLQRLVAATAATPPTPGGSLPIRRPSGRRPYALLVSPIADAGAVGGAPAVAVFISDPEQRPELESGLLVRLYGLTRAEAALAVRLAGGLTVKQAAGELAIATNTARLHLQRIMQKTGCHRQSELIRTLLASAPAAERGGGD